MSRVDASPFAEPDDSTETTEEINFLKDFKKVFGSAPRQSHFFLRPFLA